ncbi:23S rRNA pseudouridine(1911/1915/1917) synthase RluD [Halomonas ramblicola]|uniref:23S rRNA pseudouridine(1911/1915/1917) synthase RluD n=1 Tax=Halomonas ramblicola TaxID=747349 RepID=UPI0025B4F0C9|nr:23S rRNA pseudouridine(1911/1915/1917) synthase RluD [Halomonas ramblicola]MDN3521483.1 23S rRNA pseudouridine(1911/1915/1917) synthase RluD [Halomonas ramblicola]
MSQTLEAQQRVPDAMAGHRLDQAAAELFADYSRERIKAWIKAGDLTLDGRTAKPKDKVYGGERLSLSTQIEDDTRFEPEDIPLAVVFEDDEVLVIDKPAGLVVHPAAGNPDGTLLNALLHHCPELAGVPRAGIVHRLDKDTSGLMVVAKTLAAQTALVEQLQARTVSREYDAVAVGVMTAGGTVEASIGRHPKDRKRQAVTASGKPAVTHYRVVERFRAHTHVRCRLETGRTHQIRVHLAHLRYPLVGDPVYGGRLKLPAGASEPLKEILRELPRQALHARKLAFVHPVSGAMLTFRAPLPDDLLMLLDYLRDDHQTMR